MNNLFIENSDVLIAQALKSRFKGETPEQIALIEALMKMISNCRAKGWRDSNAIKKQDSVTEGGSS
jgi:hypothetical protein